MIEEPYENLFCEECKHKIIINGKDRCEESNTFVMSHGYCNCISRCIHFENDKNKKQLTK